MNALSHRRSHGAVFGNIPVQRRSAHTQVLGDGLGSMSVRSHPPRRGDVRAVLRAGSIGSWQCFAATGAGPVSVGSCTLNVLHEMPSTSSDSDGTPTPRSRVARMTKRPTPAGVGQERLPQRWPDLMSVFQFPSGTPRMRENQVRSLAEVGTPWRSRGRMSV